MLLSLADKCLPRPGRIASSRAAARVPSAVGSILREGRGFLVTLAALLLLSPPSLATVLVSQTASSAQAFEAQKGEKGSEAGRLELGRPVERHLMAGESHSYRIAVAAGQYLHVSVRRRGIEFRASLTSSDGTFSLEVRSPLGSQWPEQLSRVVVGADTMEVLVRPAEQDSPDGSYEIELDELRPSAPVDCGRVEANRILAEARKLHSEGGRDSYRRAIQKYEETLAILQPLDDPRLQVVALDGIGDVYDYSGESRKALLYHQRALEICRGVGDRSGEASVLNSIGTSHHFLTEMPEALEAHNQALALARRIGEPTSEATALHSIGAIHSELANISKALEYQKAALQIATRIGNRDIQASTLNSMAMLQRKLGELQASLDSLTQALKLTRELRDRRGEAVVLSNIGFRYGELGEKEKALKFFAEALALKRAIGDRRGEAYTLLYTADMRAAREEPEQAQALYEQALQIAREVGDRVGELTALCQIERFFGDRGDARQALQYSEQGLALARSLGNRQSEALLLTDIGAALAAQGDREGGRRSLDQALDLASAVSNKNEHALMLWHVARLERDDGRYAEASTHATRALEIVESIRASVVSQPLRASYLGLRQKYYELAIDILARRHRQQPDKGFDRLALETSERARARSLLDLLVEAHADIRGSVDQALRDQERNLRADLAANLETQSRLLARKHSEAQAAVAAKEVEDRIAAYDQIQVAMREKSPRYAALTEPQPLSVAQIRREVLDDDMVLLEYALGEERSFAWALTSHSLSIFELPKRSEIETAAGRIYDLLSARNRIVKFESAEERKSRVARADAEYPKVAAALSQMLLGPAVSQLGGKRLLIVGDGALQYVPFPALPSPANPGDFVPLAVEHEIVTLPSASVLAVLRRELAGRNPAPKTVAVLADPVFESGDERVVASGVAKRSVKVASEAAGRSSDTDLVRSAQDLGLVESGQVRIPRLRFTRKEAKSILALASAENRREALDFDASRATAMSDELGQYRFVQFATHGFLDSLHPELSGLVLSLVDSQGKPQNGFLPALEIFNLRLPADLVVLSGCRTGLGKEIKGEGLVGLTRAFMYAGAARVVVSLWDVNDEATAELMSRFYRGMLEKPHLSPAAALRAAQVSIWKEKRWESPYYWAAFILQGEPR